MPFTNDIYGRSDPKELFVVKWTQRIDFYDNANNIVPFEKIKELLAETIKVEKQPVMEGKQITMIISENS